MESSLPPSIPDAGEGDYMDEETLRKNREKLFNRGKKTAKKELVLASGSNPVSWCDYHERDKSVWSCL